jgi:hypothetical protein
LYPQLAETVRKSFGETDQNEPRANAFLEQLTMDDMYHLLIESGDIRTRIAFSSLLGAACKNASQVVAESFLKRLLVHPRLVDGALAHSDTSFWYALRYVLDQQTFLALKAFELGMLPEIFYACLGHESPVYDWNRAGDGQTLAPYVKRSPDSPPPPPPSSNYPRNAWDNAVVTAATIACAVFDLKRLNVVVDEASTICVKDMNAWINIIGCITQQETTEKLYSVLMRGMMHQLESEATLSAKLARSASLASLDSVSRYFDVVYQLGIDSANIPMLFFLGENEEGRLGFLRRVVTNRSSLFAFACITAFVERLDDFPQMKAPNILEQWVSNVDAFLREDALTSLLEPREINRALMVLEVLAHLHEPNAVRPNSAMDCDTASTASPPANGWHSDEADDDDDLYGTSGIGRAEDV